MDKAAYAPLVADTGEGLGPPPKPLPLQSLWEECGLPVGNLCPWEENAAPRTYLTLPCWTANWGDNYLTGQMTCSMAWLPSNGDSYYCQ
jgi:hypothetical protein